LTQGISEEVRDLLANVKTAENMDEWNRNPKDPDPIAFQPLRPNPGDIDNDQFIDMKYYPHRGEDLSVKSFFNLERTLCFYDPKHSHYRNGKKNPHLCCLWSA